MLFNSYEFIFLFLPATVLGFHLIARFSGQAPAQWWLILASIAFYAYASVVGLAVILPAVLFNYGVARALVQLDSSRQRVRGLVFAGGVVADVALLGYLKYWNFFLETSNSVLATHFELRQFILPLGISFLTFQEIAFLADVHSGQIQRVGLRDCLLFTLFFPRTLAGPIVRYREIMPQFANPAERKLVHDVVVSLCLFSIGLFKKTILADGVSPFVPEAFDPPTEQYLSAPVTLLTAWIGILAYTFQLYFDFSGYSDMALGVARLFGIRLPMNFNSPLRASSIVEFWGRWHITLTRFLTDYIYTPLAMSLTRRRMEAGKPVLRGARSRLSAITSIVAVPTLITMCISGVWHGVGWQFLVWGALHGVYLTVNQTWRLLRRRFWLDEASYKRLMKPVGGVLTFLAVVIALVFFRANSVESAIAVLKAMTGMNGVEAKWAIGFGFDLRSYILSLSPALIWIMTLLLVVAFCPNSLELLRRFHPAFDFPKEGAAAFLAPGGVAQQATPEDTAKGTTKFRRARRLLGALDEIRNRGVELSPTVAMLLAVLSVLGAMAVSGSGSFLYFRF